MKIAFYSNFLNNHQIPFCNKMYELTDGNFYFVETEPMNEERIRLHFDNSEQKYPYVISTYKGSEEYEKAMKIADEADIVIAGSTPECFVENRIKDNKLTFRYSERFFKRGRWRIFDPRVLKARYKLDIRYRNKNLYMLCASAYTAPDCKFIFSYPNKTYKWGYFPIIKKFDLDEILEKKQNHRIKILWVSRFIKLKHPEKPIKILKRLIDNNYDVELNLIGVGELEEKCKVLVKKLNLEDRINFLGAMPTDDVLKNMCEANIFLFTSDRQEGWGAVLNESMSCGCAVVSSDAIGSTPFLIKDGENGFLYKDKDLDDLYSKVELLVKDKNLRERLGKNALETVNGLWSAENATERLVKLFESILDQKPIEFEEGPCSRAE